MYKRSIFVSALFATLNVIRYDYKCKARQNVNGAFWRVQKKYTVSALTRFSRRSRKRTYSFLPTGRNGVRPPEVFALSRYA